jgi:endonuclease YncB( thermonuclease family)
MNLRANDGSGQRFAEAPRIGLAGSLDLQVRPSASTGMRLAKLCLAALVAVAVAGGLLAAAELCPNHGETWGKVVSVDERLELTLEGGLHLKIAGVDPARPTPEAPDLDIRGRDRLAQWLIGQEIVFRPLRPGLDRWGRLPAFVFAPVADQPNGPEKVLLPVGEAILDAGLARYEASAAARPCRASLLAAEAAARAAGVGLWADPYYAVIAATDRPSLAEKTGTAVIVEGRITGIAVRRPRIILFFGARQGWDFSVVMIPHTSKAFEGNYATLAAFNGRTVRLRGLLDTRFGPQIEISNPDEIEVIGQKQDAQVVPAGPHPTR